MIIILLVIVMALLFAGLGILIGLAIAAAGGPT
jgi:hypothetical protein